MTAELSTQTWQADRYAENARFVADLGMPVVELLAPRPGERILDLGCGDGALTEKLAGLGAKVIGVDGAADMVRAAQARGLDARVMDGHALEFEAVFDAVFSNAALHWMLRPAEVVAGVARALAPGGRFVGEFGGHGNVAAITVALVAALGRRGIDGHARVPWYFPTPDEYAGLLTAAGFAVDAIDLIPRPTPLGANISGWLDTFGESFFNAVPPGERAAVKDDAMALLRPRLCDQDGNWTADYVRLRFAARLVP